MKKAASHNEKGLIYIGGINQNVATVGKHVCFGGVLSSYFAVLII